MFDLRQIDPNFGSAKAGSKPSQAVWQTPALRHLNNVNPNANFAWVDVMGKQRDTVAVKSLDPRGRYFSPGFKHQPFLQSERLQLQRDAQLRENRLSTQHRSVSVVNRTFDSQGYNILTPHGAAKAAQGVVPPTNMRMGKPAKKFIQLPSLRR